MNNKKLILERTLKLIFIHYGGMICQRKYIVY